MYIDNKMVEIYVLFNISKSYFLLIFKIDLFRYFCGGGIIIGKEKAYTRLMKIQHK
jgi:hypothetical protein